MSKTQLDVNKFFFGTTSKSAATATKASKPSSWTLKKKASTGTPSTQPVPPAAAHLISAAAHPISAPAAHPISAAAAHPISAPAAHPVSPAPPLAPPEPVPLVSTALPESMEPLAAELSEWFKMRCVDGELPAGQVGLIVCGRSGVGKTSILRRAAALAQIDMETFHPWSSATSSSFEHMVVTSAMSIRPRPLILVVDHAEVWAGYSNEDDSGAGGSGKGSRKSNTFERWVALAKKQKVKRCTIVFTCLDLSISKLHRMAKGKGTAWRFVDVESETGRKGVQLSAAASNIYESHRSIMHHHPRAPSLMDAVAMGESDSRLQTVLWWNGMETTSPALWSYLDSTTPYSAWNVAHILTHTKIRKARETKRTSIPSMTYPPAKCWSVSKPKSLTIPMDMVKFETHHAGATHAEEARASLVEWWNADD